MIFEGVKLMFVGMTTVLLFLSLMILLILFVSYLTRDVTDREVQGIQKGKELQAKKKQTKGSDDAEEDIAAIAAAVAAYEAERFARA